MDNSIAKDKKHQPPLPQKQNKMQKSKSVEPNKNTHNLAENAKKSIDDLFVKLKKTQKEQKIKQTEEKEKIQQNIQARRDIKKEEGKYKTDENGIRYTEEGYRIYTVEELKIGKGGDTKDCPFDCQCCF